MSDILMRGIEMPRNCFECPLFTNCDACEGHECGCGLLGGIGYEEDISEDRRRDDCPLVELPAHGDLIDGDAVLNKIDAYVCGSQDSEFIKNEIIKAMPVIVPADKEDTPNG